MRYCPPSSAPRSSWGTGPPETSTGVVRSAEGPVEGPVEGPAEDPAGGSANRSDRKGDPVLGELAEALSCVPASLPPLRLFASPAGRPSAVTVVNPLGSAVNVVLQSGHENRRSASVNRWLGTEKALPHFGQLIVVLVIS